MKKAILLVRVSGDRQIGGTSLGTQEADGRAMAAKIAHEVIAVYRDEGESAKTMDRTGLLQAVEHVKRGGVDALIVWRLDRWARNTQEGLAVRSECLRHGCRLLSATEGIEDTPEGKFLTTVLLGIAELDNDTKALRAKRSMQAVAQAGGWAHKAPPGFKHAILGRKARGGGLPLLVPVEPQAGAIRAVFEGLAAGSMSLADACRALAEVGISDSSVCRVLRQSVYGGVVQGPLTGGKPVPAAFPGLVPWETWQLAHARLRAYTRRGPADGEWLLCGVARCAVCGRPVRAAASKGKNGGRYAYYDCRYGHVRARASVAHRDLQDVLCDVWRPAVEEIRAIVARNCQEAASRYQAARAAAEQRRTTAERRLSRLTDGWADGIIDAATYQAKAAACRLEIDTATIEVQAQQAGVDAVLSGIDRLCEAMLDPLTMWRRLPRPGRMRLAEILGGGLAIDAEGRCRTAKPGENASKVGGVRQSNDGAPSAAAVELARRLVAEVLPLLAA